MIIAGTSGPVKLPGLFVLMNAEILAGIVLAQPVGPGTPVIYGTTSCSTNMRTGAASIGSPETYIISSATTQITDAEIEVEGIQSIGIGGNYLMHPATLENCRTAFYENALYSKQDHRRWHAAGDKRIDEVASEMLTERLAFYKMPPIGAELETALAGFVKRRKTKTGI